MRKFFWIIVSLLNTFAVFSQSPQEELARLVQSYKLPIEYKWYNPDQRYVKIYTNKDKIYFILADSIVKYESTFSNKPLKYFHLLHKGKEVPIYAASSNEYLDAGDTIFFVGSRPVGDTTWLDPFSSYEVYFLTYDEKAEGIRFTTFDNSFLSNKLDYINVRYHFEEHHQYSIGQPEVSSQTVNGEGWVWELLSPRDDFIQKDKFTITRKLYPSQFADSATFRFFAFSPKFDSLYTKHNLAVLINNDTAYKNIFQAGKNILFEFKYPTEKLRLGENLFEVVNRGTYKPNGELVVPDVIGFQYFEYESKDIPFAQDGFASFFVPKDQANRSIAVSNFRSQFVVAIDTISKEFAMLSADPKISFWVNSANKDVRININDTLFTPKQNGLHIVAIDSVSNSIMYLFYPDNSVKAIDDINQLPSNSVYIAVFNGTKINNDVTNFFKSQGSNSVDRAKDGFVWIFAKNKATGEKYETFSNAQTANLVGYFNVRYSNRYSVNINLREIDSERHFYLADGFSLEQAKLKDVQKSNYFDTTNQADVIVVAPRIFKDVAQSYIDYRKTTNPEKTFFLALTEDIYKEFNFGKKSPEAIKRFLVWAYYKWKKPRPRYVTIWGDANFDTRNVLAGSVYKDFVPTFGWPPTDAWYTFLEGNDFTPDIHLGRIPIQSVQDGYNYIEKLKEYDQALTAPWMKKFLFLSGGQNELEREYFYDRLKGDFADFIIGLSPLCATTQVIRKSDAIVGSEADASYIRSAINDGTMMMIFAGHGSAKVFDTDGWKVQTLNNKGKYGFFASFSCNTANFAEPTLVSRNEEYTTFPEKGFIGTLGSGGVSVRLYSLLLASHLLNAMVDSTIKTDYFIDFVDIAKEKQIRGFVDFYNILTIYHYVYLGDPLLRMRFRRQPDLYFIDNKVEIVNELGKSYFTQSDSLFIIKGLIGNIGFSKKDSYYLWLIHSYNGASDTIKKFVNDLCSTVEFQFQIPINKRLGRHNFKIVINPEQKIFEYDFANNSLEYNIEVFASSLFPVEPLSNWNVDPENPLFRFVDPNFDQQNESYTFKIFTQKDTGLELLTNSQPSEIDINPVRIDWKPNRLLPLGHYFLFAQKESKDTTIRTQSLWLPFHTKRPTSDSTVLLLFSTKDEFEISNFNITNLYFDTITSSFRFKPIRIPYKIMSCVGNARSERGKEITVNNKVYVTMAPDLDIVGFHVVIISHKDFSLQEYKIFETWGTEPPEKDSSSIYLVNYLRDSVPEKDYIFLLMHNSALRVPIAHQLSNPRSPGSLDSLRQAFREWGCKYADSLGSDLSYYGNSFFMVGRVVNGQKVLIDEGFDLDGDTVQSEGYITQVPSIAKLQSPMFGPAKRWSSVQIGIVAPDTSIHYKTKLFGISIPYGSQKEQLNQFVDSSDFDLSKINASEYPYLLSETEISNPEESINFEIKNFQLEFTPVPEIAMFLDSPKARQIDTLRGEELDYAFTLFNLSTRSNTDTLWTSVNQMSKSQNVVYNSISLPYLGKNQTYHYQGKIVTDKFDNHNTIVFNLQQKTPELYSFNNTKAFELNIQEDQEKPRIILYLDGMKISGGEFVSKKPSVYFEIYDNSHLPFDSLNVTLLINIKKFDLAKNAQIVNYGRNVPLKCTFTLESDELEYGVNYFTIYATDATGNRDTLDVPVYVSRKAKIQNFSAGPNPATDGVTFYVNFISPKLGNTLFVEIFDMVGNKIRTLSKPIGLNEDYIFWDGLDSEGRSTPQGVYFYKINVLGEIYSDPVFGKFVKIQ